MLHDLIDERRVLRIGGRAYTIKRVTLSAVVRLMDKFGRKLPELQAAGALGNGEAILERFSAADLAEMFSWLLEPPDAEAILKVFVNSDKAPDAVRALSAAVAGMNDLAGIWKSLNLPTAAAAPGPQKSESKPDQMDARAAPSSLEIVVDGLARRYGRPPHEIMEWPYEEILELANLVNREAEAVPSGGQDESSTTSLEAATTPASILNMIGGGKVH